MKGFNTAFLMLSLCFSFLGHAQQTEFLSFGKQMNAVNTNTTVEAFNNYQSLKVNDTISTKFSAIVTGVCQAKGCWMTLSLEDGKETMVRFKDYGFFMPMDIVGKEVVVNGLAFVEEMSVEDQRHFAKDVGVSDAEIAKINKVKKTYSFEADAVLLKK
ncbi:MAG: DUF4920 domain-containing protein [Flavobacteriaceae bacterium]|nr:MAG: DUF4920 domain-containing protein [Flavobacteriaceae bacterium]